jgi:predicted ATP-grasp superfamily ATP-dependent carboligase
MPPDRPLEQNSAVAAPPRLTHDPDPHRRLTPAFDRRAQPGSDSPAAVRRARASISGRVRVLVTGGDHTGPLAAVRALHVADYEPWVAASKPKAYAARSRAAAGVIRLPDSGADPEAFIESLITAAREFKFRVVLGGIERDLLVIASARERLGALAAATAELKIVRRITSKKTVYELAADAGLKIPTTIEIDRSDLHAGSPLPMPVILKPQRSEQDMSAGGFVHSDVQRVNTAEELRRLASALPGDRWLVQSVVEGSLGAICGVAWNGEIVCAVHQRAQRIWPADRGMSAYAQTVAPDLELEARVARLIGLLDWSGIFQVQFIHADGEAYLIDLNPRVYGSLALATAAGVNLPAIWVALVTGSAVEVPGYQIGIRYRAEELDAQALLHLLCTGNTTTASRGLIPRRHTVHAVASLADPLPVLTSIAKLRRLVINR